ncbi:GntR family transcriptional regulator [Sulfitobacter aestuarii]|uniref:GntR family transcriptional regulator n=1 Tax=Sulfitobacter aestuarii TaxID=2161676 RepID=A0ABW5U731_9RHOB
MTSAVPTPRPGPQYKRIMDDIRARIASEEFLAGGRIPSESMLVQRFGVSRMTVNRALRELESEGILTRIQGVGTFVSEARNESAVLEIRDIAEEISMDGRQHSCRCLTAEKSSAPRINSLLGLPGNALHFRTLLLHFGDDAPVLLEERFVNPGFAPDFLQVDFSTTTAHAHLMGLGTLQGAEHVFEAEAIESDAAGWLQVPPGTPCLLLRRRTWSRDMVVSIAILTAPGSSRRYAGVFGEIPQKAQTIPKL